MHIVRIQFAFFALLAVACGQVYPNVPGRADTKITQENIHQTICNTHFRRHRGRWQSYSKTVRPATSWTNALKRRYMDEGHLKGKLGDWELDHDIPIAVGGCPDCEDNLRMELWPEAKLKDVVESYVYYEVCSDRLSLAEGQRMVLDWRHVDVHGSRAGSRAGSAAKEKK